MKILVPLLFAFLAGFALSQQLVDGVVAIVGEKAILQSDLLQSAQIQAMQEGVDLNANPYKLNEYLELSLQALINQHVVYYIAEEDTLISVTEEEVDTALEQQIQGMIRRAGTRELLEEALGKPLKSIKHDYRQELEQMMLIERYQQNFYYQLDVTRSEVIDFFEAYRDSLPVSPPRSKFSLIEVPVKPGADAEMETVQFLAQLADSIRGGADFADLAGMYSDDNGTSAYGGDLGYINRGTLVKAYEEVAYSLDINEISPPVKTEYGYHIIQLLDKQGEKVHTRHILRTLIPTESDREAALKSIRSVFAQIEKSPEVFDSLATTYAHRYENNSGVFGWRYDTEISDEVLSLLQDATESGYTYPSETKNNSFIIGRLYDRMDSMQPTLENSWEYIEQLALQKKMNDRFDTWITEAKEGIYIKIF